MPKFFVLPEKVQNNKIIIDTDDVAHIRRVLRMNVGDELLVCDSTVVVPPSASLSKRYLLKHLQCLIVVAVADEIACCTHLWIVILCTAACIIVGIAAIETTKRSTCSKWITCSRSTTICSTIGAAAV